MKGLGQWGLLALCVVLPRDLTWLLGVRWVHLSRAGMAEIHASYRAQGPLDPQKLASLHPKPLTN